MTICLHSKHRNRRSSICSVQRRQRDIVSHRMTATTSQTAVQFASIPFKEGIKTTWKQQPHEALSFTGSSQDAGWSLMKTASVSEQTNDKHASRPYRTQTKRWKLATNIKKSSHQKTLWTKLSYEVWINIHLSQSAVNPSFYNFPQFMNNTNSLISRSLTYTLDYCLSHF